MTRETTHSLDGSADTQLEIADAAVLRLVDLLARQAAQEELLGRAAFDNAENDDANSDEAPRP